MGGMVMVIMVVMVCDGHYYDDDSYDHGGDNDNDNVYLKFLLYSGVV